jgi:hypothetical protein
MPDNAVMTCPTGDGDVRPEPHWPRDRYGAILAAVMTWVAATVDFCHDLPANVRDNRGWLDSPPPSRPPDDHNLTVTVADNLAPADLPERHGAIRRILS